MTASFVIQPCLSSKDGNSNGRQRQRQHLGNGDYFVIIASADEGAIMAVLTVLTCLGPLDLTNVCSQNKRFFAVE